MTKRFDETTTQGRQTRANWEAKDCIDRLD